MFKIKILMVKVRSTSLECTAMTFDPWNLRRLQQENEICFTSTNRRQEVCLADYNISQDIASRAYKQKSSKVSFFKPIESPWLKRKDSVTIAVVDCCC